MALFIGLLSSAAAADEVPVVFVEDTVEWPWRIVSFFGLFLLCGLAWLMSENRAKVPWKLVLIAIGMQLAVGAIVLIPYVSTFFYWLVDAIIGGLNGFAKQGMAFVFQHAAVPYTAHDIAGQPRMIGGNEQTMDNVSPSIMTFAFWVLPTIIFYSALVSLLYYLGVMQRVVQGIAWVMARTLGTSGSETVVAAANIFLGQTEAPLLIRPYIASMTRSEIMVMMTAGFATAAGGILAIYAWFLSGLPNVGGHLVIASVLSAIGSIAIAKILVPETEASPTAGSVRLEVPPTGRNLVEAVGNGAVDGIKLVLNIVAVLIAIVALVAMLDWVLSLIPVRFCDSSVVAGWSCPLPAGAPADAAAPAGEALTLAKLLGWVFSPIAVVMGVPVSECLSAGRLLGEKMVLTEFLAFPHLGAMLHPADGAPVVSQRTATMLAYALCGFANFASIGIQIGGIGAMASNRTGDLAALGLRAMIGGSIASCMSAAVAGIFVF